MKSFLTILIFISGLESLTMARDLSAFPLDSLEIPNTKIFSESEAKRIALKNWARKMYLSVSATDIFNDISIVQLGFNITNFADRGDKLWQVKIKTLNDELKGIMLINPDTEKVYYVFGPWKAADLTILKKIKEVPMKTAEELKSEFDRLSTIVENNSDLLEQVKIVYYEDNHRVVPSSKQLALQELYLMISKSDSTTSAARKALEFFINTDSKDIVRQSLINTRMEIDAWGLIIIASEAVSKTKDEKAIPYLIYTLAKNNYVQTASEDSTIHAIVKQKLIIAIKTITNLDIDISGFNVDDPAQINSILTLTKDWAKKHDIKLLDE